MNVNIWGPSMWVLLQNTAFILDETSKENVSIYENLRFLLPCSFCRDSFNKFIYPTAGTTWLPQKGFYAKWVYELHSKVNKKLNQQHVDDTVNLAPQNNNFQMLLQRFLNIVVQTRMNVLFKEPSFEVVQKRYIVSQEEPFRKLDVDIVLLTLAMYGDTLTDTSQIQGWKDAFTSWTFDMYGISRHPSFAQVYTAFTGKNVLNGKSVNIPLSRAELVEFIKNLKYQTFQRKDECASLIKAGACVKNTCQ